MAPAMNDLLSGEIAIGFANITAQVVALHRSGKIRILAINAPARLAAVPDIPTAAEAGLANFVSQTFFGVFAAAGTTKPALDKINVVTQTNGSSTPASSRCSGSAPTRRRATSAMKSRAGAPSCRRAESRRNNEYAAQPIVLRQA